jgi:hypothetical protein
MKHRLRYILLSFFFVLAPVHAAKEPITLELSIVSAFTPYIDTLFGSPAYAALAFQNSGTPISLSKQMRILSPKEFQIGTDRLKFESKKGNIYTYRIYIGLPFGKEIAVPVEVEVVNSAGKLNIRSYPLGSSLIPQELITKIESKIQSLANMNAQKNLIDYLDARTKGRLDNSEIKSQLFSQITFDAINQMNFTSSGPRYGGDVGQAEPLSTQWPLIFAVAIWIIGLPIGLYLMRLQKLRSPNSQSAM